MSILSENRQPMTHNVDWLIHYRICRIVADFAEFSSQARFTLTPDDYKNNAAGIVLSVTADYVCFERPMV